MQYTLTQNENAEAQKIETMNYRPAHEQKK